MCNQTIKMIITTLVVTAALCLDCGAVQGQSMSDLKFVSRLERKQETLMSIAINRKTFQEKKLKKKTKKNVFIRSTRVC
ncbi:MAG: hypothetical protein ABH869_01320 [Candidatus Omnitrophota bacterium]